MIFKKLSRYALGLAAGSVALLAGCAGPLERTAEQELREQLLASNRAYLEAVTPGPVIELSRRPSEVERELSEDRREKLDQMSGPLSYQDKPLDLGPDLLGHDDQPTVALSLQRGDSPGGAKQPRRAHRQAAAGDQSISDYPGPSRFRRDLFYRL